jgi:hypothetical protein
MSSAYLELRQAVLNFNASRRAIAEHSLVLTDLENARRGGDISSDLEGQIQTQQALLAAHLENLQAHGNAITAITDRFETRLVTEHLNRDGLTQSDVQTRLEQFFSTPLPLVDPPYRPLCGRLQMEPECVPPPGSFVCITIHDRHAHNILGIFCDSDSSGGVQVYDAAPKRGAPKVYDVPRQALRVLPQCLPAITGTEAEYTLGERVMALFKDADQWTTVFYPASIVATPKAPGQGYQLLFDGEGQRHYIVPEKYIVPLQERDT